MSSPPSDGQTTGVPTAGSSTAGSSTGGVEERVVPSVSRRSQPRFASRERRDELADAFAQTGAEYDRLRPGYPLEAIQAIAASAAPVASAAPATSGRATSGRATAGASAPVPVAVDLGAGTGKLTLALAERGMDVVAVDPSASMLETLERAITSQRITENEPPSAGPAADRAAADRAGPDLAHPDDAERRGRIRTVRTVVGTAEETGLEGASADVVASAQAWHWFDTEAASQEARRLLKPGGVLALVWNTMDVQVPWVHRYSRIMHAGDIQKDDFAPPVAAGFELAERVVVRWEDPMPTQDLIDLARTRSYVIKASDATRAKVLGNLDWYLHDHLGHAPGDVVPLPYRTDLFLFRAG